MKRGATIAAVILASREAHAVRPFITDDARVVGKHRAQIETWVRHERGSLEHWIVPAFGPIEPMELTIGFVHGATNQDSPRQYAAAGPLLQTKILLRSDDKHLGPGIATIFGSNLPFGFGGFRPDPNAFGYLALTQSLPKDRALFHFNLGMVFAKPDAWKRHVIWGVGTQVHLYERANLVGELFSGDPYQDESGGAVQGGLRFAISESVQLDSTVGTGLWGAHPLAPWVTGGLRMVSHKL